MSASTSELMGKASDQFSELIRDELRLAQLELAEKGKRSAIGLGLLGASGALAFYGFGALITAAILGLATALAPWLAALIVGAVLLVVAALAGTKGARQTKPPIPRETAKSIKVDIDAIKEGVTK